MSEFSFQRPKKCARWLVATLGVGLIVSGCSIPQQEMKPAPASRFIKTQPRAVAQTPTPAQPAQQQARIAKEPKRDYPEPTVLGGLTAENVEVLMGVPSFKRNDEPAEIWQYKTKTCTLDLFMYQTLDSEQRSVAHFETRANQGQSITTKECFISVLKAVEGASKAS